GMPSKIKAFMDRLLPTNLPFMSVTDDETSTHPPRYDLSHQRYLLISTCGFYSTKHNYEALLLQFDILYGPKLTKLICSEGELFRVPQLKARTSQYLDHVKIAGKEYADQGHFSADTQEKLSELLYPPDVFIGMADASWEITPHERELIQSQTKEQLEPQKEETASSCDSFIKQMSLVYNPKTYEEKTSKIIEMHFTDKNKTYQLIIDHVGCTLKKDEFLPYNTRIETPFSVWQQISTGKLSGEQALFDHQYRVLGEFKTLVKMDQYFGSKKAPPSSTLSDNKKSSLLFLLLPWIALWSMLPINAQWAGIAALIVCSLTQLLGTKFKLTNYDYLGLSIVSLFSLVCFTMGGSTILVVLTYLLFGLFWLSALVLKIPLTAHYSYYRHGGISALENPLFIRTNRIVSVIWGLFYVIAAIAAYFLMGTVVARFTGLILAGGPLILGIFTPLFVKLYPKYYAQK
ncbi:MAG: NAD(P)H dehydrogenase, partial [Oscillospiraceae bacterium]